MPPLDLKEMVLYPYEEPYFFYSKGHHPRGLFIRQLEERFPVDFKELKLKFGGLNRLTLQVRFEYYYFMPYCKMPGGRFLVVKAKKGSQGATRVTVLYYQANL